MIKIIIILLFTTAFTWIFLIGINRQERKECLQWQAQATEFSDEGWYATDWQTAQCQSRGIVLN